MRKFFGTRNAPKNTFLYVTPEGDDEKDLASREIPNQIDEMLDVSVSDLGLHDGQRQDDEIRRSRPTAAQTEIELTLSVKKVT